MLLFLILLLLSSTLFLQIILRPTLYEYLILYFNVQQNCLLIVINVSSYLRLFAHCSLLIWYSLMHRQFFIYQDIQHLGRKHFQTAQTNFFWIFPSFEDTVLQIVLMQNFFDIEGMEPHGQRWIS